MVPPSLLKACGWITARISYNNCLEHESPRSSLVRVDANSSMTLLILTSHRAHEAPPVRYSTTLEGHRLWSRPRHHRGPPDLSPNNLRIMCQHPLLLAKRFISLLVSPFGSYLLYSPHSPSAFEILTYPTLVRCGLAHIYEVLS